MNIEQIKGQWKQIKGDVQAEWGALTDDDLDQVEGDAEKLIGLLQEKYGKSKEEAREEINAWLNA